MKGTLLDGNLGLVASQTVYFDSELSDCNTKGGVCRDPQKDDRIVSPTLM
jgi:xylulokinase